MAIPSMSRLGALKISLENDLVHIYAKWGSSSSLRTDFPPCSSTIRDTSHFMACHIPIGPVFKPTEVPREHQMFTPDFA